jgi:hypothetical protein
MNPRIKPIHFKIFVAIIIDAFLLLLLLLVSYTFFFKPVRAENVNLSAEASVPSQICNPNLGGTNNIECLTETLEPRGADTLEPSPTNTLEPSETDTLEPSPTNTVEPSATNTLEPSPTNTLAPSNTSTFIPPSPTDTPKPSVIPTLNPTSTQTSTVEPRQPPSPTNAPPYKTNTPKPSQGYVPYTKTPSATPTTAVITCTNCYIVKDFRELIVSGLYTADLLNTEEISSTFKVSITLYNVYKGAVVGKAINMVDTQPAHKVMVVETPLWCISPVKGDVYWIHTEAKAERSTGEIWFVTDEWVRINFLDGKIK